jgi:ribosomal protein S18 acetylase RimI-like enzyme
VTIRSASSAEQLLAAGALVACEPALAAYGARVAELVERVRTHGANDECDVLLALDGDAGRVLGAAAFGLTAGARGAGALHGVAVSSDARRRGVGRRLVHAAEQALHARGARLLVAEVAADPRLHACHALLVACGFAEEARVDDYFRDGVPLVVWCRRLG